MILFSFYRVDYKVKYPLLTYCYPFLSLVILLCMSTSYPHYYLFLLPSLSILFSINIASNTFRFSFSKFITKYFLLAIIIIVNFLLVVFIVNYEDFIEAYSFTNLLLFYIILASLILSFIVPIKILFEKRFYQINLQNFFFSIVIPQYIFISLLFNLGILGSPNIKTKLFLRDNEVSSIIRSNTIYLLGVNSKIETLLLYYLPSSKVVNDFNNVNNYKYLITSDVNILDTLNIKSMFRSIKKFDNQFLLINLSKK